MESPAAPQNISEDSVSAADVLEFVSSLADSLGWPIAVLVIVLAFRRRIGDLINNIATISIRGNTITFARELDVAKGQAENAGLSTESIGSRDDTALGETARFVRQARESSLEYPRAAIIEGWLVVEGELIDACERLGLATSHAGTRRFSNAVRRLRSTEHLNANLNELLQHLRRLRNNAAHDLRFDVSPNEAQEYIGLCGEVVGYLQRLGRSD